MFDENLHHSITSSRARMALKRVVVTMIGRAKPLLEDLREKLFSRRHDGRLRYLAMQLHDFLPSGNGYKVRLALRWLGIPFAYHEVNILKGETRTPAFLGKNAFGQIPVLELDDGTCLRESNAILLYVAEGTPLLPSDKLLRTRVIEWMSFEQTHVDGVISRARFRRQYPDVIPTRPEEFEKWHAEGTEVLRVLDEHLRTRTFLVDERFTIADISLYAYTHCATEGGFDIEPLKAFRAWCSRIREQRGHLPIDQAPGA
jgi:glutathione S-transferase